MTFIKYLLLFVLFCVTIYAGNYTLRKNPSSAPVYFIKMGAYTDPELARKALLTYPYDAQIIFMEKYYSIVSHAFSDEKSVKKALQKIRKKHKDAYLITLYKKTKEQKTVPQSRQQPSLLQKGIMQYDAKQYEEALAVFDRILIETPDDPKARLYYAKSLYQLHFYDDANKAFRKLLEQTRDKKIQKECRYYLSRIEHKRKKHFFKGWISAGAAYDNNINLTTDKNTTQYGPYLLQNNTNKTSSSYATLTFLLNHTYKAENFILYSTLYSYNELFHSAKGNNINFIDFSTAVIKKYKKFSFIAPFGINTLFLDSQDIATNIYTNPALIYRLNNKVQIKTNALINDNHTAFSSHRDYLLLGIGTGIHYSRKKWAAGTEIALQKYNAKEDIRFDINKDLTRYKLFVHYNPYRKFYIDASANYEKHNFRDLDPVMGYKREDRKNFYTLSLTHTVRKKGALTASCTYTDNHSNINTFTYNKNNYALTYKQRF